MEILIKNQALERDLEEIGEAFRALYPEDYADFIKYVHDQSQHLIQPNGISPEGTIMNFMKIPCAHARSDGAAVSLYEFIKQEMRARHGIDDFFRDSNNYRLLCKVWRDAYVSKKLGGRASGPVLSGAREE